VSDPCACLVPGRFDFLNFPLPKKFFALIFAASHPTVLQNYFFIRKFFSRSQQCSWDISEML